MISPVFTAHLMTTGGGLSGKPLCEETDDDNTYDISIIEEALTVFGSMLNTDDDLELQLDAFLEEFYEDLDPDLLKTILVRLSEENDGDGSDDDIKSILKTLAEAWNTEPSPKPSTRYPNEVGMTPLSGEDGIKKILRQHPIAAHQQPFGTKAYDASNYKAFNREANRYGKNYSYKNDYNNQFPNQPSQNPILRVSAQGQRPSSGKAYESVDSVGLSNPMHYRVMSVLTGQYVTKLGVPKEEVDQITDQLNQLFQEQLAANPDLIKEFEAATSMPSEIPATNLQEGLNDQSNIARYAAYLNKPNHNYTSAGSLQGQKTDPIGAKAVSDWRAAQMLIERTRRTDEPNEQDALNARSTGRGRK